MGKSSERLADFTNGWHRHTDNDKIVVTTRIDIFRTAANDASCQAAILRIEESAKHTDRSTFKKIWDALNFKASLPYDQTHLKTAFIGGQQQQLHTTEQLNGVGEQLRTMASLFCNMSKAAGCTINLFPNWRESEQDARDHDPHPFEVLNRVFFSKGTMLPTNTGATQVDEGDYLYMKPYCAHYPEFKTRDNKAQDRLTIVAF